MARLAPGDVIAARYRIVAPLAAGGMGEVFEAQHLELGKSFALKVMLPGLAANAEFVKRFKIEAIAASRIGHPNIVDISDFGQTEEGRFFFVMELLDGVTLTELVKSEGALTPARAVRLSLQVARALEAAHAQGIVHRDLKPDNVIVVRRPGNPELVKVLDFGVARVAAAPAEQLVEGPKAKTAGQTAVGKVVGTPQYMSPEQAKGLVVDARSDIYALGLTVHELLSGAPAFSGNTPHGLMVKQVTEPPPPLPDSVPEGLRSLVSQLLEKHPDDRPQKMSEVIAALESLELQAPSKSPVALLAVAALVVLVAGVGAFVMLDTEPPTEPPAPPKSELPRLAKSSDAVARGEAALKANDYAAALAAFEEVEPASWTSAHGAGVAARKTADLERAKKHLTKAIELARSPREAALAHFELGCALSKHGEKDAALSSLRQAVKLIGEDAFETEFESEPDLRPLRTLPEFMKIKLGNTKEPPPKIDDPIQPGSSLLTLSNAAVNLITEAMRAEQNGDPDLAAAKLERCIKVQPNAHPCLFRLGQLFQERYQKEGSPEFREKARAAYQRFLKLAPADDPSVPEVWALLRKMP